MIIRPAEAFSIKAGFRLDFIVQNNYNEVFIVEYR
jgi:hypothetical protein